MSRRRLKDGGAAVRLALTMERHASPAKAGEKWPLPDKWPLPSVPVVVAPAEPPQKPSERSTITDSLDVASSLAAGVPSPDTRDTRDDDVSSREASIAGQPPSPSSPGMRSFMDARVRLLEEAMPHWGCGDVSIFGLHDAYGPDLLFFTLEHAFRRFNLFEHFTIDALKLQQLTTAIVAGYNDHPYHNYIHGCDVAHGTYWMLSQKLSMPVIAPPSGGGSGGGGRHSQVGGQLVFEAIPAYAVLAGLLGAAIHDIGHDGYNNAFHVATGSPLAMKCTRASDARGRAHTR